MNLPLSGTNHSRLTPLRVTRDKLRWYRDYNRPCVFARAFFYRKGGIEMLDIKLLRENPDFYVELLNRRGGDFSYLYELVKKDSRRREIIVEVEVQSLGKPTIYDLAG